MPGPISQVFLKVLGGSGLVTAVLSQALFQAVCGREGASDFEIWNETRDAITNMAENVRGSSVWPRVRRGNSLDQVGLELDLN